MNNFDLLALGYLQSWLDLMIVSIFVLESKRGTFKMVSPKHETG